MIFVTVSGKEFERLVEKMDEIAVREDVVMQIGKTQYEPKNAKFFRFATQEEIHTLMRKASVIVTHAGVGSVIASLRAARPTVLVPRHRKHGESVDDHQSQIAEELANQGRVVVVYDIGDLEESIKKAMSSRPPRPGKSSLLGFLDDYLMRWSV